MSFDFADGVRRALARMRDRSPIEWGVVWTEPTFRVAEAAMNYHFTDGVRGALARARDETIRLRHDCVAPGHILLGLLGDRDVSALLDRLGVAPQDVRADMERLPVVRRPVRLGSELPYTSGAKRVLERAMAEAREQGDSEVRTEHLLLGVLHDHKSEAVRTLRGYGVTLEQVRDAMRGRGPGAAFVPRVDDASERSIYEQLVAQVQEAVATGRLRPGERLPSVRSLADQLDIAPGTVARAWTELERLGVVVTEGARGTRVAERAGPRPDDARAENLVGLLRPVVVAAFHLGATAAGLREALERAMSGIFNGDRQGEEPAGG
ncbi:MAG TPA: Clp protease N-terminal domain-containing protein [Longimicrobium sp.]|jgi:DNA-binding transcriptional regulator YhcF (GntR family)